MIFPHFVGHLVDGSSHFVSEWADLSPNFSGGNGPTWYQYNQLKQINQKNIEASRVNRQQAGINYARQRGSDAQRDALINALWEIAPDHPLFQKTGNIYRNGHEQSALDVIYDRTFDQTFRANVDGLHPLDFRHPITKTAADIERERQKRIALEEAAERKRQAAEAKRIEEERLEAERKAAVQAEIDRKNREYRARQAEIARQAVEMENRRKEAFRRWALFGPDEETYQYLDNPDMFGKKPEKKLGIMASMEESTARRHYKEDIDASTRRIVNNLFFSRAINSHQTYQVHDEIKRELMAQDLTSLGADEFVKDNPGDTGEYSDEGSITHLVATVTVEDATKNAAKPAPKSKFARLFKRVLNC